MQLDENSCLAFEDSASGIQSSLGTNLATIVTVNDYTVDHDFSGASIVLDQMGEPDENFTVLAGDAKGYGYLNCDLLVALHQQHLRK